MPSVAQNVHSTRRTVVTIGLDDRKEQSLRENHAQARERVRAGYHIHSSRSRKHLDAAFTPRPTVQNYQFRSWFLAGRSGAFQSRFWTSPVAQYPQIRRGLAHHSSPRNDEPSLAPPLQRCGQSEELHLAVERGTTLKSLPNFNVRIKSDAKGVPRFPVARLTSLVHEKYVEYNILRVVFPTSTSGEKHSKVFSHALKAVQTNPLLDDVKRLRIWNRHDTFTPYPLASIETEAARLFKFVGLLEELVLDVDDLRPFLSPFFDPLEFQVSSQSHAFPLIEKLTIAEQPHKSLRERRRMRGCHSWAREVTAHAGNTLRACNFPYEVSSRGDGGEAGTVGWCCEFL